ncbi:MAG: hypothetical protein H6835_09735 [Planctomycetes bacterium]|nr:hypothetical protein [Planctomycetota bacterium]
MSSPAPPLPLGRITGILLAALGIGCATGALTMWLLVGFDFEHHERDALIAVAALIVFTVCCGFLMVVLLASTRLRWSLPIVGVVAVIAVPLATWAIGPIGVLFGLIASVGAMLVCNARLRLVRA